MVLTCVIVVVGLGPRDHSSNVFQVLNRSSNISFVRFDIDVLAIVVAAYITRQSLLIVPFIATYRFSAWSILRNSRLIIRSTFSEQRTAFYQSIMLFFFLFKMHTFEEYSSTGG